MKKLLSIFMLSVMLVVGVGPTVAMHFCGESLRSVEVLAKHDESSCCGLSSEMLTEHAECESLHERCCETKEVQIVTDTFQIQERLSNIENSFFCFDANWLTPYNVRILVNKDLCTIVEQHFPPDGYDIKNQDILTFISILRI